MTVARRHLQIATPDGGLQPPYNRRMTFCKSLIPCLAAALLLAGCSGHNEPQHGSPAASAQSSASSASPAVSADARKAVRAVVERFGTQMQKISVLAPPDDIRQELPETYASQITPELMAAWTAHPDQTIGREGSSPWPTQIVIHGVDCSNAVRCHVTGKVDYITSNELEHGGVLYHRNIALDVVYTARGWRIGAVNLGPAPRY